ncbi:hypothetical protein LTR53_018997 [Teratosphaeriaceae sp. CCFEE 6253]|nr:hypothetical protein LTR53_018997 [Teratosphaeriaceae sp. CCFEE 6253]
MTACERRFAQAVALWGRMWPDVDGDVGEGGEGGAVEGSGGGASGEKPIEIEDDEEEEDEEEEGDAEVGAESPFAGTGWALIAAHNRAAASVA